MDAACWPPSTFPYTYKRSEDVHLPLHREAWAPETCLSRLSLSFLDKCLQDFSLITGKWWEARCFMGSSSFAG